MRPRGLTGLLVLAGVLLFVLPSATTYYTDWLWFQEIGYAGVFVRTLNAQTTVFAATFTLVFLFLYANLKLAGRRSSGRPKVVIGRGADGQPISVDVARAADTARPVAAVIALLIGLMGASRWFSWLSYLHATPFGTTDPLFNRDVGFYIFDLPIYQLIRQQSLVVSVVSLIGCTLLYVFSGSFVIESRAGSSPWPRLRLVPAARRHLSVLTALVLGLLAWGAWLEVPSTLITPTASRVGFGVSYADVHARIPFLWATVAVLATGAALSIWHGFGRRGWPLPLAIVSYLIVSTASGVYAGFVQRLIVQPNELDRERPYLLHNIQATRAAYNLNDVEERNLSGNADLSARDIINNAGTIENVRLWDHEQLLQTFGQIQVPKPYYEFRNIDNDRYLIDGKRRQVMLSVREVNPANLPARSWLNERLSYTHGYGLTLGPVNQVTTEGLPVLFIRDIPPISTVNLPVNQPSIYYGEGTGDYVIVGARQREFHYPQDPNTVETEYDGAGGVAIGSLWRRLLFAIRFASTDILVTGQLTPQSRILFNRNIRERLRMLAPFLTLDADPYPVLHDGRILWIQDAYTTSRNYPYASRNDVPGLLQGANYVRNSVKIVTDAYHGSIFLYLAEADDPIAQTIGRIFPGLLKPIADMPASLRAHVRYPEDIFLLQAEKYATYHMTDPQDVYNYGDLWQRPVLGGGIDQGATYMEPYYTVMKLPGEADVEFIQMLPFTPNKRENLAAWMAARSDGAHYGKLVAYRFPKERNVFGPSQIVARINQDQVISPQITLWNQQGSQVILGSLLVIPVNESLLYVRPLYLRSAQGKIPELKQVIVAYQSQIVMKETLRQGLATIFGPSITAALAPDQLAAAYAGTVTAEPAGPSLPGSGLVPGGPVVSVPPDASLQSLAAEAAKHLEAAKQKQREYDEELAKLQEILRRMQTPPVR